MTRAPVRSKKANPFRLGSDILPVAYDITLKTDFKNFTFKGSETVTFRSKKPFSSITLHALELTISKAEVYASKNPSAARHKAKRVRFDAKMETVTFEFGKKFKAGEVDTLYIEFSGIVNDKLHGFYRTSYEVNGQKLWGAATQFEATDARRAFPCWDEPDKKATFKVTLSVPKDMTALSNMPVQSERLEGDTREVTYEPSPIMSTYLLCFVVAHLEYVEGRDKNNVLVRIYTTPGKKEQGRFALDVALFTLPYFSEWFGIPYALPKCDMVALPDFSSGAMENWGLITYRETALLVDPVNSSASAKQRVAEVVDHELAHQWFGNLVTMEWWTDLWLNEGFASYMGPKAVDKQFPDWNIWSQYLALEYLTALKDDSLRSSHPIEIVVQNPHEIREIFDHITYNKGSSVNRMLEHYLNEEVFRKGLRKYLKKYAWGNAKTGDLWKALEEASGKPVRAVMAGFTKKEGYPVISANVKNSGKKMSLELSQQRFIFDGSRNGSDFTWKVPVTLAVGAGNQTREILLDKKRASVDLPDGADYWIKINPGQSGFYRTAYPPELLARLAKAIAKGELAAIDTLGVVDDAFALARAGHIPTSSTLTVLEGCKDQTDYNVWLTVAGILGAVENILSGKDLDRRFASFGLALFTPVAQRSGWTAKASDGHLDLLLRPLALGRLGHFGDEAVIGEAKKRFNAFSAGGELDPNLRSAVYACAAEHGGEEEYEKLLALYRGSDLQEEKARVLRALTYLRIPAVIAKALAFTLSAEVRSQDSYIVLAGFGGNKSARAQNWEFIKKSWKTLSDRFSGGPAALFSRIIDGAVSGFTTEEAGRDAETFLKKHPIAGTERTVKQALEVVRANGRWAKRDTQDIAAWLAARF